VHAVISTQDEAMERLWSGIEVRRWTAVARTRVTVRGAVDAAALTALRSAIAQARSEGHLVSLDLDHITSVRRSALGGLLEIVARVSCQRTSPSGG
jgi:hypothetical protein